MRTPYRKPGKFSQMKQDPLLTKAKFIQLENKLARLKSSHPGAAAEVKRLAEMGDFSENAAYQMAKGRLRGINSGIRSLENQLNRAEIITPQKQFDTVHIGHTVTIETDGREISYQILGSAETNPQKNIISHNSPIGAALLGHRVGETVHIQLADKEVGYRIMNIE